MTGAATLAAMRVIKSDRRSRGLKESRMSPSLEIAVRVGGSAAVFATMALWEWFAPRRHLTAGRRPRWPGNLGILAIDIAAVRLLVPATAVGVALIATTRGWGLFAMLGLPALAAIPLGVIALDLVIYTQHVVFHHVPVLWRLHRMHHADLDIDVSTAAMLIANDHSISKGCKRTP